MRRHWPLAVIALGLALMVVGGLRLTSRPGGTVGQLDLPAPIGIISPQPAVSPSPAGYRVRFSAIGVDLPVVQGDGQSPPLFVAAEEPGMRKPGQGGRSMIYAHARAGMFGNLRNARVGEGIDVSLLDGRVLKYRVTRVELHWSAKDASILGQVDHEQLVLLTCTTYNPNDPRVVVFAEPA